MTTSEYPKPLPAPTEENGPYIEGLAAHELRIQRCAACRQYRYPAAMFCPNCLSDEAAWETVSGRGTIYSFIIIHQLYHPGFKEDLPYSVAVVELEEGPRVTANVVGCPNEMLKIGMPVEPDFLDAGDGAVVMRFRPR
jgi:uncharacterized OB-fold protein